MSSAVRARNPLDLPLPSAKPKPIRVTPIGERVKPVAIPAPMTPLVRMKELEELAQIACDENDKLKREVAELREENEILLRRISVLEVSPIAPEASRPVAALTPLPVPPVPMDNSLASSIGELEGAPANPTQDLRRRNALLHSLAGLLIAVLLVGGTAFVGLIVLGARTEMRWARTGFEPAQLRAGIAVARETLAPLLSPHPRYGRSLQ